jgi:translocator protein
MKNAIRLTLCILIPLIIGGISGYFTSASITTWYVTLNKPFFNPPNYLFGPVWTTLYILMGISFYIILKKAKSEDLPKLSAVFVLQLMLNFLWSFIFFKYQNLGLALIEIVLMWCSILTMILLFYKTDRTAGLMNIPYLLWVSFASLLNAGIYYLN